MIKIWNRAAITALHEFAPEDNEVGIWIAPVHIGDEFDLFSGMLVSLLDLSLRDSMEPPKRLFQR